VAVHFAGLYANEKEIRHAVHDRHGGLFLCGAFFGYHYVFPGSLGFLFDYSKQFKPLIEISEYTDLFNTVILGLGITFELPILVMFLSLFGIVSPKFLWKNIRYAILIIFIIAAIITPTPDVLTMCVFASPMLVLYLISIGVSFMVHPARRRKKLEKLLDVQWKRTALRVAKKLAILKGHDFSRAIRAPRSARLQPRRESLFAAALIALLAATVAAQPVSTSTAPAPMSTRRNSSPLARATTAAKAWPRRRLT
jgi:hypothetical protein